MNIYLNNIINASKIVTFNNIPTIVYLESNGSGDKARLEVTVGWGATNDIEYYLSVNEIKVVATTIYEEAVGNVWWTPTVQVGDNYAATSAYTLARALNNTELANNYKIFIDMQNNRRNVVVIEAKEFGSQYNFKNVNTNADFISYTNTNGTSSDLLNGSTVLCSVYAIDNNLDEIGGSSKDLPYVATFQKRYYKNGIKFDISPVLNSLTKNGEIIEYNVIVTFILNNEMRTSYKLLHNYAVNGYQCNLGLDYLSQINNALLAQNVTRGTNISNVYNKSSLYYVDKITFSIYKEYYGTFNYQVKYLDSALNIVKTVNASYNCDKPLNHVSFIPEEGFYYVDIVLPQGTVRYMNVKPNRYANPSDKQNVYWYNSYGGVSFFPFTGKKEENRETDKTLYKTSNYDYYNNKMKSYRKVYNIQNVYEVTLTSHYLDENGKYLFNDLNNALEAWTYVNGKKYEIIIKSVEIEEQANNGVYLAKVKFEYSLADRW